MVLTDPPYGTTACKWDSVIPLEPMWNELKRIIKTNGAIGFFGTEAKNKLAEIEQEKAAAEQENKRILATNLVEEFAKSGRIKNDAEIKEKWINKAIEDFDFVKESLENLPVNRVMPEFGKEENKAIPYNAANLMQSIQAKQNSKQN